MDSTAIGSKIIEIHFASKRKPSQKEGNNDGKLIYGGLNKKTVDMRKIVNTST